MASAALVQLFRKGGVDFAGRTMASSLREDGLGMLEEMDLDVVELGRLDLGLLTELMLERDLELREGNCDTASRLN